MVCEDYVRFCMNPQPQETYLCVFLIFNKHNLGVQPWSAPSGNLLTRHHAPSDGSSTRAGVHQTNRRLILLPLFFFSAALVADKLNYLSDVISSCQKLSYIQISILYSENIKAYHTVTSTTSAVSYVLPLQVNRPIISLSDYIWHTGFQGLSPIPLSLVVFFLKELPDKWCEGAPEQREHTLVLHDGEEATVRTQTFPARLGCGGNSEHETKDEGNRLRARDKLKRGMCVAIWWGSKRWKTETVHFQGPLQFAVTLLLTPSCHQQAGPSDWGCAFFKTWEFVFRVASGFPSFSLCFLFFFFLFFFFFSSLREGKRRQMFYVLLETTQGKRKKSLIVQTWFSFSFILSLFPNQWKSSISHFPSEQTYSTTGGNVHKILWKIQYCASTEWKLMFSI